jgi:hypothetical protein
VESPSQVRLGETEALGDARQIPDRVDRRLHHAHAAMCGDDPAVGVDTARRDGRADFRHVDVGAGHRDGRPDIVAARELVAERLADQMPPRVERYDLPSVEPLRVRADALDRRGIGQVGDMVVGERSRRNRERAVDRIAARMATDRVAVIRVAQGRDHRPALGGSCGAPDELRPLRHGFNRRPVCGTEQRRAHYTPLLTPV